MAAFLSAHAPALFTLVLLAAMFVAFAREIFPPELTAFAALATLLAVGILSPEEALAAMANPAAATIACMFVLSGALTRVGVLESVSSFLARNAAERPTLTVALFAVFVVLASALVNNTPIVVMLIPVALRLAEALRINGTKVLIPLSYCAILGGLCTLIGTSTNLIVDGVARQNGLAPFSLFEITPLGLILAAAGLAYMALIGRRLLPDRPAPGQVLGRRHSLRFLTEVAIPEDSVVIGRLLVEAEVFQADGVMVIDVLRGDKSLRHELAGLRLAEGDRVVLRTGVAQLIDLRHSRGLKTVDRVAQKNVVVVEALLGPGCTIIGRRLGALRLRRRYGVYPLAVHRRAPLAGVRLDDVVMRLGDTLMLEGDPDDIARMGQELELTILSRPVPRPYRRERAPLVLGVLAGVVGGAALGLAPLMTLAMLGVAVVLTTRCLSVDEAWAAVNGRLVALILAMLGFGAALAKTGALELAVSAAAPALSGLPVGLALFAVIAGTSLLTEMVTNNAVAVVMTPVAIVLAQTLGVDARPLVVGVMVAASLSFATPIGYQTNTLVYAAGGYRFGDYLRVGLPLNLLSAILASLLIPLFWPF